MTLRTIGGCAWRIGVDIDQRWHHREVAARVFVATRAARRARDGNMVGRFYRRAEVRKIGAVAIHAIAAGRMFRVQNHERPGARARSRLEPGVLRRRTGRHGCGIQWVLTHRHPSVVALVATRTITRHAAVDLRRRRRRL